MLLYLPPNATSKIQPCDAGIMRNFRAYYRRRFNRQLLDRLENNQPDAAKINVLEKFSWRMQHGLCMCSLSASATALRTANSAPTTWTTLQTPMWTSRRQSLRTSRDKFYRLQADSSLSTHQLEGQKESKERMTMTMCSNADGSDKFLLWVIGKFLNPRCFKDVDRRSLGVAYHANKNAWMTRNVFKLWLEASVKHVAGRKVILILDNCSAHIKEEDL